LKEFKEGEPKSAKPSITPAEYREKYSQRILLKLESKINDLEGEIRKRKKAEDELRTLKDGLELKVKERTSQLENEIEMHKKSELIKSDFLSRMSHEFRTPLNAIIGFSEILKMKTPGELNEKQEHYIDNIHNSGQHLLGMINDMLDLLKIESGDKLPLSIESFFAPDVIGQTMIFVQEKAARKGLVFNKEIDPELGNIITDKLRFKQILLNLLDNAVKFSKPQGGTVTVKAVKAGDMAQFSISDTGIGIREKDIGKIFGLFHQVDTGLNRRYGGAGSGLAITKQLVEQQGGKLLVQSIYGQGSTFTFTLPLVANMEESK
jgi:signal transduction histidine kinase